ncbi:MAG TPA: energy transducer TonB [Archangium sp.]|uniref:energy transducer TonB n=1 Tax=Archangium sp. TaxID=1872627 RepID=UPI002E35B1EE|nr:energy transducer TonB [Archangium sp.]HEX5751643.1 energy transducer TonB [Archangium sp.]
MFDSVQGRGQSPRSRIVLSVLLSLVLHAGVLLLVFRSLTRPPPPQQEVLRVSLLPTSGPPMAAPPPPPATVAHGTTPPHQPGGKKPDAIVRPRSRPQEPRLPEGEPKPDAGKEESPGEMAHGGAGEAGNEAMGGVVGGVVGGMVGGAVGGVPGGQVGGVPGGQVGGTGTGVLPFSTGMTRPRKLSGPKPEYTREALAARVEGVMIVRCVITLEGRVEQCRVLRSLPYMEQAVLDALYAQRYQPVTSQGHPIAVDYTFNIRLSLPR